MGALFSATTEGEEALAAATAETVIALMGVAAVHGKLVEFGISFDGVTAAAEPVQIELYRITANGTATGATEAKWDLASGVTAQITAHHSYTVEPTKTDRLACWEVHPQGGSLVIQYPLGREPTISNGSTSSGLAIVATAPAIVNVVAYVVWEE